MKPTYFQKLHQETRTRFWVNNPTRDEARLAIAAGAISCTTNPTYSFRMLRSDTDGEGARATVDEVVRAEPDDGKAAEMVQRRLAKILIDEFSALFERHPLSEGFVSVQGDPLASSDPQRIIDAGREDRKLGANCIVKIPVTPAGLTAIEEFLSRDVPVIATEIMAVSQAMAACDLHARVTKKTGRHTPLYVTHITGILDEYLAKRARETAAGVRDESLLQAGSIVARRQYRLITERGYRVTMLGGGARALRHFTEMVGADVHVTINWQGTAENLVERDPPIQDRIHHEDPRDVVEELSDKLPDFRKAYMVDGLTREEFEDFGPAAYFRDMFIEGWKGLQGVIRERRKALGASTQGEGVA
jgi:transaldolase